MYCILQKSEVEASQWEIFAISCIESRQIVKSDVILKKWHNVQFAIFTSAKKDMKGYA